jgi:hypothetical protein
MTLYRLLFAPNAGPFVTATEAVMFALRLGWPAEWKAVAA